MCAPSQILKPICTLSSMLFLRAGPSGCHCAHNTARLRLAPRDPSRYKVSAVEASVLQQLLRSVLPRSGSADSLLGRIGLDCNLWFREPKSPKGVKQPTKVVWPGFVSDFECSWLRPTGNVHKAERGLPVIGCPPP